MKCEVVKDLMTLYVEDMCSPESKEALEEHVKECAVCAGLLEKVKNELVRDGEVYQKDYAKENEASLKPLRKVKKSLFRRKLTAIVLGLLLVAILAGIGVLSYGQVTNRWMSFSAIADAFKVKSVCEKLVEGDTQALLDVVAFRIEEYYNVKNDDSLTEGMEEYKKYIQSSMDEAYAYYFEGKDIKVKIEEIWLTPYDENLADNMVFTSYLVGFYEKGELIYSIDFGKITPKKYVLYEEKVEGKPNFAANVHSYDDVILDIALRYSTVRTYDRLVAGETVNSYGSGLKMGIRTSTNDDDQQKFSDGLEQRLKALYESGWYFKDVMFAVDEFDKEMNHWIYKVWFLCEHQEDGTLAMLEQRFAYYNSRLYVLEEEEPTVLARKGEVPEAIEEQLINLFR